ncbi:MAG: hypothetical protein ACREK6_06035 [Candidatus Rokuibacteriota bacterium]
MKPLWRKHKTWILTAALVVAPFGGVALILYGLARLAIRKRKGRSLDPYAEWLALREQLRRRPAETNGDGGEPRRSVSTSQS